MNALLKLFFPGVDYPGAFIWQFILGAGLCAAFGYLFLGWDGYGRGPVAYSIGAGLIAVTIGLFLYFAGNGRGK